MQMSEDVKADPVLSELPMVPSPLLVSPGRRGAASFDSFMFKAGEDAQLVEAVITTNVNGLVVTAALVAGVSVGFEVETYLDSDSGDPQNKILVKLGAEGRGVPILAGSYFVLSFVNDGVGGEAEATVGLKVSPDGAVKIASVAGSAMSVPVRDPRERPAAAPPVFRAETDRTVTPGVNEVAVLLSHEALRLLEEAVQGKYVTFDHARGEILRCFEQARARSAT